MTDAADRRLILLLGTPRSGTTWLAAILNSYPGVVYSHEPLSRLQIPRLERLIERIKTSGIVLDNERREILRAWSTAYHEIRRPPFFPKTFHVTPAWAQMVAWVLARVTNRGRSLFRWGFSPGQRGSFDVLVKDIDWSKHAQMLIQALDPMFINIIRHPCAVVASLLHGQSLGLMPEHSRMHWYEAHRQVCSELGFSAAAAMQLERCEFLALEWLVQNFAYREAMQSHQHSHLIVYEELCCDPIGITERAFGFLGWEMGARTLRFIKQSAKERKIWLLDWLQAKHPYFGVRKDPLRSAESWRGKLTQEQKAQILAIATLYPRFQEYWSETGLPSARERIVTVRQLADHENGRASENPAAARSARSPSAAALTLPLLLESGGLPATCQPVSVGLPFPKGILGNPACLRLSDSTGEHVPLQTRTLSRWPDGTVRWVLLDFLARNPKTTTDRWQLGLYSEKNGGGKGPRLRIDKSHDSIIVDTGVVEFHVGEKGLPFYRVSASGKDLLEPGSPKIRFSDTSGRLLGLTVRQIYLEEKGPLKATLCVECATKKPRYDFTLRLSFFAGSGLARVRLTIHNPRRARHRGGLWDLGDAGSVFFRELAVELSVAGAAKPLVNWKAKPDDPCESVREPALEIYQDSSGGENWRSKNHVNWDGRIPCSFRGYRVRQGQTESTGHRASPLLSLAGEHGSIAVAVPEFWQQFPKALQVRDRVLKIGLFPEQFDDFFELQGGEQKTHAAWFEFAAGKALSPEALAWVHQPVCARADSAWYADSGAIPYFTLPAADPGDSLETILNEVIEGKASFFARREIIDEYGWRNYGDIYADHEVAYYRGELPLISHYNNQYDFLGGALLQYLRTGNSQWMGLADALARHVIDIDIYHTRRDRAAYNGGLFWHTDHYLDAATSSHRAFSAANCHARAGSYGGGPSNEHNYTSGLLLHYYLTGDRTALDAVIGLADWVINRDDGEKSLLGVLDNSPTGLASSTLEKSYHGPGRGAGNSINALLDAWLATSQHHYLETAENLIRRVVHPADDVTARDLLDVERRWSYTVFLSVLARYLLLKEEAGMLDYMYAYAQASLVTYAKWMLENEKPYFDQAEKLQYPTETWAAQELRKANVFRLAAGHVDEPLRSRLFQRGTEFARRAWHDLLRFESRRSCRPVAILMTEGTRDAYFKASGVKTAARPLESHEFGLPERFVPQRERVLHALRGGAGMSRSLLRLVNPRNWWRASTWQDA